jgi:uncharacterized protein YdbL (DUF1318 family)
MAKNTLHSILLAFVVSLSTYASTIAEAHAQGRGGHHAASGVIVVALIGGVATVLAALLGKQA